MQALVQSELEKWKTKFPEEQHASLDHFSNNLVNKILHQPSTELKKMGEEGLAGEAIWVTQKLFGLQESKNEKN